LRLADERGLLNMQSNIVEFTDMAIAFVNVRFLSLGKASICRVLAYLSRDKIFDANLERDCDYSASFGDLVHSRLVLPEGLNFASVEEFANALDAAERKRMRKSTNRQRWPQIAVAIVIALPPEDEVTLDEAVELIHRFRQLIVGSRSLASFEVIHDRSRIKEGDKNRHAHVVVTLRAGDNGGFHRKKERDFLALPRNSVGPKGPHAHVAEAIHWPSVWFDIQQAFFAERAIDLKVDPPAPVPQHHWSLKSQRKDPHRRKAHTDHAKQESIALIKGAPVEIVELLLRDRAAAPVRELEQLLARFFDSTRDRHYELERILADQAIVALAPKSNDRSATWIATRAANALISEAIEWVDRSTTQQQTEPNGGLVTICSGSTPNSVHERLLAAVAIDCKMAPIIIGQVKSHCDAMEEALTHLGPNKAKIGMALKPNPFTGQQSPIEVAKRATIILPRGECISDLDLAKLLKIAKQNGARVFMGYDSTEHGRRHALATSLADRFGQRASTNATEALQDLGAGLVNTALKYLAAAATIEFVDLDCGERADIDFVVCDDPDRLRHWDRELHSAQITQGHLEEPVQMRTARGTVHLSRGQWIVCERTDYSCSPPVFREGSIGKIKEIQSGVSATVEVKDGSHHQLDFKTFFHVRSAYALTLREAPSIPLDARVVIEVSSPIHVWAALMLLAQRPTSRTYLRVSPSVACNLLSFLAAAERSLPYVLPTNLVPFVDPFAYPQPPASETELFSNHDYIRIDDPDSWLAPQTPINAAHSANTRFAPEVGHDPILPLASPYILDRNLLHKDLRAVMTDDSMCRETVERLAKIPTLEISVRNKMVNELLKFAREGTPLALLVRVLAGMQSSREPPDPGMLELEMSQKAPRSWTGLEYHYFRIDLQVLSCRLFDSHKIFEGTPLEIPDRRRGRSIDLRHEIAVGA
jgi:hypothetical protein